MAASEVTTNNTVPSTTRGVSQENGADSSGSTCAPYSSFQENIRQWFITLSPEDRVTSLVYMDEQWMTLCTQLVAKTTTTTAASSLSPVEISTPFSRDAPQKILHDSEALGGCNEGNLDSPKRTTDRSELSLFDWQRRIPFDDIERKWREIINVPVSSTLKITTAKDTTTFNDVCKTTLACAAAGAVNDKACNDLDLNKESDAYRIPESLLKDDKDDSSTTVSLQNSNRNVPSSIEIGSISALVDCSSSGKQNENGIEQPTEIEEVAQSSKHAALVSLPVDDSRRLSSSLEMETVPDKDLETNFHATYPIDQKVLDLLNNVCSIFPVTRSLNSSMSHSSNITITEEAKTISTEWETSFRAPFIILHPSYITSISGEELLSVLDDTMAAAFPHDCSQVPELCAFIPSELPSNMSAIDALRSFAFTMAAQQKFSSQDPDPHESMFIPLYVLIILRFRIALLSAFFDKNIENHKGVLSSDHQLLPSKEIMATLSFAKKLKQLQEKDPLLTNDMVSKLTSKFPGIVNQSKFDKKTILQDFLMLPLDALVGFLLQSPNTESQWKVLYSINTEILSSLVMAFGQGKDGVTSGADVEGVTNDLEALVASLDESHNKGAADTVSNNPNVTGGKKSKRKKKKKKKSKGGSGTGTYTTHHQKLENLSKQGKSKIDQDDRVTEDQDIKSPKVTAPSANNLTKPWLDTKMMEKFESKVLDVEESPRFNGDKLQVRAPPSTSASTENDVAKEAIEEKGLGINFAPAVMNMDIEKAGEQSETSQKPRQVKSPGQVLQRDDHSNSENVSRMKEGKVSDRSQNSVPANGTVEDDEQWETVGARPRDRRKKGAAIVKAASQHHGTNSADPSGQQTGNKKKSGSRRDARRRSKNRKIAMEILNSVLDNVEESVKRRSHSMDKRGNETVTKRTSPLVSSNQAPVSAPIKSRAASSVVLGGNETLSIQTQRTSPVRRYSERKITSQDSAPQGNTPAASNEQKQGVKPNGFKVSTAADQNTVPTIPETLSTLPIDKKPLGTDSSSGDSLEAQKSRNLSTGAVKDLSPSPPLPTLLSPGNNNSSSSSVASSLDAPHGNLPDPTENEVGYHLLGVCKRLSDEIALFMKRRNAALSIRRHERKLVLAALEETLSVIWPNMCSVEMYGSCATNLDLPSSDLDVVVCGLDRPVELVQNPSKTASPVSSTTARDHNTTDDDGTRSEEIAGRKGHQEMSPYNSDLQQFSHQQMPLHHTLHMMYPQISPNAERVMRLAVELEHQPWAVHVKAIPTATVPVIKILADPARLSGALGSNSNWLVQHSMSSQTGTEIPDSQSNNQSTITHYPNGQSPPFWRGADVVNGLLKVDITFEGPEHGGIGSTKFSLQAVEEFAAETGLTPEATPAVMVLMVLKELLAQRRLNEPFSGGLSSYALLLLVISVIKERAIIREELEKAERQRRVVAAGGGNSALRSPVKSKKAKDSPPKPESERLMNEQKVAHSADKNKEHHAIQAVANPKYSSMSSNDPSKHARSHPKANVKNDDSQSGVFKSAQRHSSWAFIARQSSSSGSLQQHHSPDHPTDFVPSEPANSAQKPNFKDLKKPSSFADAVANGVASQTMRQNVSPDQSKTVHEKPNTTKKDRNKIDEKSASDEKKSGSTWQTRGQGNAAMDQGTRQITEPSSSAPTRSKSLLKQVDRMGPDSSAFPQGFHDVVEVLCSGDTTPGKLLLHFLLFYGQHFDSQSTAIDFSGTHQRDASFNQGYSVRSPYMQRSSAGNYDPVTGMLTVDPIVVYDPLEGAENNNVARSCFAWSSIRWLFAQSYMTLSSTVETNASQGKGNRSSQPTNDGPAYGHDQSGNVVVDPNSPLLELLLSY